MGQIQALGTYDPSTMLSSSTASFELLVRPTSRLSRILSLVCFSSIIIHSMECSYFLTKISLHSLAPDDVLPTQLKDAALSYTYLVIEEQIPAGNMILSGDSAGGHLALSLLVHLESSLLLSIDEVAVGKLGGLVLMSPWLSLYHEPISFTTNAHMDVLSGTFLRLTVRRFLGHDPSARGSLESLSMNSPLLEFHTSAGNRLGGCTSIMGMGLYGYGRDTSRPRKALGGTAEEIVGRSKRGV